MKNGKVILILGKNKKALDELQKYFNEGVTALEQQRSEKTKSKLFTLRHYDGHEAGRNKGSYREHSIADNMLAATATMEEDKANEREARLHKVRAA